MANPAVHQGSFLGGEWAATAQGSLDDPMYKQALNVCVNGMPVAEKAFVRRAGCQFLGPTYKRGLARILPYRDVGTTSYLISLTASGGVGYAHYFAGTAAVTTVDGSFTISTSSSSAGILTIVTTGATGWSVGDQFKLATISAVSGGVYANRVMTVKTISGTTITAWDDLGVAFTFDSAADVLAASTIRRLVRATHLFTNTDYFQYIRAIQAQTPTGTALFMVERNTAPQVITTDLTTISTASFKDGPYLDPQGGNLSPEAGTVNAYSGSITFTPATSTFVAADVGRHIRLWTQPAAWASGTTYAYGDRVTYNNQFWTSIGQGAYATSNVGIVPGTVPAIGANNLLVPMWAPDPLAGRWAWGTITAQATTSCTVSLTTNLNSANGASVTIWRLGVFKAGQYPACGIFHEGRLWFAGMTIGATTTAAPPGMFCASTVDDLYTFSPTDIYGNVADNHGFTYVLSSKRSFDSIRWMEAVDTGGLLVGTAASEWLLTGQNDAFTATTVKATEVTSYGSAQVEPVRAGLAIAFVQRFGRTVYEYLADAFSTRFAGRPLNEKAKHLVASASADAQGFYRLAYQEEKTPVIWALGGGTALFGCTYRRESRFVTEPPTFAGWHRHLIYDGQRIPTDVAVTPGGTATANLTYLVTQANGIGIAYAIEVLRPLLDGED